MSKYKLEYIWLDGHEPVPNLRSKTAVKEFAGFPTLERLPLWNFDGSSTRQAEGGSSDCLLKPVAVFPDRTRKHGALVMCEVLLPDGSPPPSNSRAVIPDDPGAWLGFEQVYFLVNGPWLHCSFSTESLRGTGGRSSFDRLMRAFHQRHDARIAMDGSDDPLRLTALTGEQGFGKSNYGTARHGVSIRLPRALVDGGYRGYLEDRRPSPAGDPYKIVSRFLRTLSSAPPPPDRQPEIP